MPHNNTNIIQAKYFLMVFLQAMISFDLRTSIAVFSVIGAMTTISTVRNNTVQKTEDHERIT